MIFKNWKTNYLMNIQKCFSNSSSTISFVLLKREANIHANNLKI